MGRLERVPRRSSSCKPSPLGLEPTPLEFSEQLPVRQQDEAVVLVERDRVGKLTVIFGRTSGVRMKNLDVIRKLQADAAANGDGLAADFARRAADRLESLGDAFANGILAGLRYNLYAHFAPAGTVLTYSEFMERRLGAGDDDPYAAGNLEKVLDYAYVKALAEQAGSEDDARPPDEG